MRFLDIFSRREKLNIEQHARIDEYGYRWIDTEFFGFGDLSQAKDNTALSFPSAEEYLKLHGEEYPWRELWLEHGTVLPSPSRKQCLKISRANGHVSGNCYNNALQVALGIEGKIVLPASPREIRYGEGMAVHPTGAYLHAWLVVDGEIYDPTWPDAYRATYFGMTFDPKWMLDFAEDIGRVSLLQNWSYAEARLTSILGIQREPA